MSFASLFALLLLLITTTANASPMSNEDVASMLRAGMNEATVIQAIEASDGPFDTSANGLINLKKAGATDAVLQKVIAKSAPAFSVTNGLAVCAETPGKEVSIFMHDGDRELYLPTEKGTAGSSISSLSVLGSALTLGVVPVTGREGITFHGARAGTRIASRTPTFPHIPMPSTMSPSDYPRAINLVHLKETGGSRVLNFMEGKLGVFGAGAENTAGKYLLPLTYTAEGPNCSFHGKEVTPVVIEPQTPLAAGEYAILQAAGPGQVIFYTFGID